MKKRTVKNDDIDFAGLRDWQDEPERISPATADELMIWKYRYRRLAAQQTWQDFSKGPSRQWLRYFRWCPRLGMQP